MNVMILDSETNGLKNPEVREVAVLVYSVTHRSVIKAWSTVVETKSPSDAVSLSIHHIPNELHVSTTREQVAKVLKSLSTEVDAIVCHNSGFDRKLFPELHYLPWVCTLDAYKWSGARRGKLTDIAVALGVPVIKTHRALADVNLLLDCLEKDGDFQNKLNDVLSQQFVPRVSVSAELPYEQRDDAVNAGFMWDKEKRLWTHSLSAEQVNSLSFPVNFLGPDYDTEKFKLFIIRKKDDDGQVRGQWINILPSGEKPLYEKGLEISANAGETWETTW